MALNETQVTTLSDANSDSGMQIQSIFAQIFANFPYYSVLQGRSGGQVWYGGNGTGEDAEIHSNTSKDGLIKLGDNNNLDEATDELTLAGQFNHTGASRIKANRATAQAITSGSDNKVQYATEEWDNLSEYDNATNYRFTAAKSGYYKIYAKILFDSYAWVAGNYMYLVLYKDGVLNEYLSHKTVETNGTYTYFLSGSADIYLAANSYVEIFCFHNRGSDTNIYNNSSWNKLSIHRLS